LTLHEPARTIPLETARVMRGAAWLVSPVLALVALAMLALDPVALPV